MCPLNDHDLIYWLDTNLLFFICKKQQFLNQNDVLCLYVFNIFKQWFAYFNRKLTLYYQKNCFLNNKKVIFWYFLVDSEGIYLLPKIQITLRSNKKSVWKHQFSEKDKIHQKNNKKLRKIKKMLKHQNVAIPLTDSLMLHY